MLDWIANNIWTIVICAVLAGIVAAIIINMIRKKKQGKSVVCNCGNCPKAGACRYHAGQNK